MGSAVETVLDLRLHISEIEGRKITADNRIKALRYKGVTVICAQRKSGRSDGLRGCAFSRFRSLLNFLFFFH